MSTWCAVKTDYNITCHRLYYQTTRSSSFIYRIAYETEFTILMEIKRYKHVHNVFIVYSYNKTFVSLKYSDKV